MRLMKTTALQTTQRRNGKVTTPARLSVVLELYSEYVRLDLDRSLCIGCDICSAVCPRKAISVRSEDGRLAVDVDPETCILCEVCTAFCPTGALSMEQNGRPKAVLAQSGGVAEASPRISIDLARCPEGCELCLPACPRHALSLDGGGVAVDEKACLGCPHCTEACPVAAIEVTPLFEGGLAMDTAACPQGCDDCVDLCPTGAIQRRDGTITVVHGHCVLCGACINACTHGAVAITRTSMHHGTGFSAAWSDGLAALTGSRTVSGDRDSAAFRRTVAAFANSKQILGPSGEERDARG